MARLRRSGRPFLLLDAPPIGDSTVNDAIRRRLRRFLCSAGLWPAGWRTVEKRRRRYKKRQNDENGGGTPAGSQRYKKDAGGKPALRELTQGQWCRPAFVGFCSIYLANFKR